MVAKRVTRRKPVKKRAPARKRTAAKKRTPTQKKQVIAAKTEAQRISHYLRALETKKGRGPKKSPEVIERRLGEAKAKVPTSTGLRRLQAVQKVRNLERELAILSPNGSIEQYEKDFIASAKSYSQKNNIDYGSWRAVGVPARVLKKAGIAVRYQ